VLVVGYRNVNAALLSAGLIVIMFDIELNVAGVLSATITLKVAVPPVLEAVSICNEPNVTMPLALETIVLATYPGVTALPFMVIGIELLTRTRLAVNGTFAPLTDTL
jgi:hypothetical protein